MTDRSWCHPSFLPVLDRIPERGYLSPNAFVEYECPNSHTHQVILGNGLDFNSIADGESLEEAAGELADAVDTCEDKARIDQHGESHRASHSRADARNAYFAALQQLQGTEYDRQHAHAVWLAYGRKKWGGHVPGAVLLPSETNPRETVILVPDTKAEPVLYGVRPGAFELPDPRAAGAIKRAFGWHVDRRRKPSRLLRLLRR